MTASLASGNLFHICELNIDIKNVYYYCYFYYVNILVNTKVLIYYLVCEVSLPILKRRPKLNDLIYMSAASLLIVNK